MAPEFESLPDYKKFFMKTWGGEEVPGGDAEKYWEQQLAYMRLDIETWEEGLQKKQDLIQKLTRNLLDQNDAINILADSFMGFFDNAQKGWQNMLDTFSNALNRFLAEMAAKLALSVIMDILAPGTGMALRQTMGFSKSFSGITSASGFANGGIAYGSTLARVGEYPGVSTNPEVIAPLNKLRGILGDQSVHVTVDGRISGKDIALALRRQS